MLVPAQGSRSIQHQPFKTPNSRTKNRFFCRNECATGCFSPQVTHVIIKFCLNAIFPPWLCRANLPMNEVTFSRQTLRLSCIPCLHHMKKNWSLIITLASSSHFNPTGLFQASSEVSHLSCHSSSSKRHKYYSWASSYSIALVFIHHESSSLCWLICRIREKDHLLWEHQSGQWILLISCWDPSPSAATIVEALEVKPTLSGNWPGGLRVSGRPRKHWAPSLPFFIPSVLTVHLFWGNLLQNCIPLRVGYVNAITTNAVSICLAQMEQNHNCSQEFGAAKQSRKYWNTVLILDSLHHTHTPTHTHTHPRPLHISIQNVLDTLVSAEFNLSLLLLWY